MARVKCKSCKKGINKNIAIPVFFEESKRNYYFCCEDCRISYFKKKQEELKQQKINELERQGLSLVYEYVRRELFGYTEKQQLPKSFITRLQDLRNGTMRGKSFHRQSKNGYDYEVIFETFKKNDKLVRYCLTNKLSSANESQKLNYIMAIIESKINDVCNNHNGKKFQELQEERVIDNILSNEIKIDEKINENNEINNGIMEYLNEDDIL